MWKEPVNGYSICEETFISAGRVECQNMSKSKEDSSVIFFSEIIDLSGTPLFICVLTWQICFQIEFEF